MKRLLIVLLPISLFVFSCEDNDVVDTSDGVKVQWIIFGGKTDFSGREYLWFVGTRPLFLSGMGVSDTDYDG